MDIRNSELGLLGRQHDVILGRGPVGTPGEGINGNAAKVASAHQILQGLRRLFFIDRVLIDGAPHYGKILLEGGFFGSRDRHFVAPRSDRKQDEHDRHHDHHLEQSKSRLGRRRSPGAKRCQPLPKMFRGSHRVHQLEYCLPSSAVPVDCE